MAKQTIKIKIDDTKWRAIKKELKKLDKAFTLVGLHEGENYPDGFSVASIGAINEFGTNDGRIPERPWMRGWFDANRKRIEKFAVKLYDKVIAGKLSGDRALKLLGEWVTGELKKSITDLQSPPNAPLTIALKGSSNPLIDTGQMRNLVTHKEVFGVAPSTVEGM